MAVRSTVADSLLGAFTGIGDMARNTQQYRLNEQTLADNQTKLDRQGEKDLFSKIENAGNYRIKSPNPNGPLDAFDFHRLAKERPDLAMEVLNSDPRFNVAVDERGRKIQTKVSGFDIQEDGSVTVTVTRPDGRKVPVTRNRTAQNDDVVASLTQDDFQDFGQRILGDMAALGAVQNPNTWFRDMNQEFLAVYEAQLKEATKDKITKGPLAEDPGATTQLGKIVVQSEGQDTEQIAQDMGVDTAAVEQDTINTLEQNGRIDKPTADKARKDGIRSIAGNNSGSRRRAGRANAKNQALEREKLKLEQEIANTESNRERLNQSRAEKGQEPFDFSKRDGLPAKRERLAEINKELGVEEQPAEPAEPNAIEQNGSGVAQNITTPQDVSEALADPDVQPTEEDIAATGQVLQQYGVQEKTDLIKLPPKELMQVAFMVARRQGGSVDDMNKVAQQIINLGTTGDIEESGVDAARLGIQQDNINLRRAEFVKSVQDSVKAQVDDFNEDMKGAIEDLGKIKLMSVDEDGEPIEPTPEMTVEVGKIWDKSMSLLGTDRAVAQSVALEATMYHLQSIFATSSPGWLEWSDSISNIWNQDGQLRIGKNSLSSLLRAKIDSKSGEVTALFFRDANGGEINFPMSLEKFKDDYGEGARNSIAKLAKLNTQKENREAKKAG